MPSLFVFKATQTTEAEMTPEYRAGYKAGFIAAAKPATKMAAAFVTLTKAAPEPKPHQTKYQEALNNVKTLLDEVIRDLEIVAANVKKGDLK